MGIPKYMQWISKNFPECINEKAKQREFDHVFIDINNLLYIAFGSSKRQKKKKTIDKCIVKLYRLLDNMFRTCVPKKTAFLALDGPAPFAKMQTQRKRRLKRVEKGDTLANDLTFHIQPGTLLMYRITKALEYYVCSRLNGLLRNIHMFVSGSSVPGEGELKIMGRLLQCNHNESFALVGSDADLMLLSLATMNSFHNISIFRYQTQSQQSFIEVRKFVEKLVYISGGDGGDRTSWWWTCLDFVLLSLFLGNDYVPKLKYFNFNWAFRNYLKYRRTHSNQHLLRPQPHKYNLYSLSFNWSALKCIFESSDDDDADDEKQGDVTMNDDDDDDDDDKKQFHQQSYDTTQYTHGLMWILTMYIQGTCVDYNFNYAFTSVPPYELFLKDGCKYENTRPVYYTNKCPLKPHVASAILTPRELCDLLPGPLRVLTTPAYDTHVGDWYSKPIVSMFSNPSCINLLFDCITSLVDANAYNDDERLLTKFESPLAFTRGYKINNNLKAYIIMNEANFVTPRPPVRGWQPLRKKYNGTKSLLHPSFHDLYTAIEVKLPESVTIYSHIHCISNAFKYYCKQQGKQQRRRQSSKKDYLMRFCRFMHGKFQLKPKKMKKTCIVYIDNLQIISYNGNNDDSNSVHIREQACKQAIQLLLQ